MLDNAAALVERVPTTEADGDAMDEDARDALPAPPLPVAAPGGPGPAPEPTPATATESGEGDGDAAMPDAPPVVSAEVIARRYQEIATGKNLRKERKPAEQKIFDEAAARQDETAASLVARIFDATSKPSNCYKSLASVFVDIGPKLDNQKKAIFGALEGRSAADFLTTARAPEPVAAPAPATPRATEPQPWEDPARKMLDEVRGVAVARMVPVLKKYSFTVPVPDEVQLSGSNFASPPDDWPCVFDIIGKDFGGVVNRDVINSKPRLVDYLEEALKRVCVDDSFRSQSQKKADDARAAALAPPSVAPCNTGRAKQIENSEADVAHWHDYANQQWKHNLYRDMLANNKNVKDEPCMLMGPSNKKPPTRISGFYAGPLPSGTWRGGMTEEKCTTAEQLEAWFKAKRVHEIVNGVPVPTPRQWHLRFGSSSTQSMRQSTTCGSSMAWTSCNRLSAHLTRRPSQAKPKEGKPAVPGVYHEEYKAWKAMGGKERPDRKCATDVDYSRRGLYATAIREAIDAMRRDDPQRFYGLTRAALRRMIARSDRHVTALAKHAGVDKEDLVRFDERGYPDFVSGSGPCRLPGVLHGLVRKLNIEHENGTWVGNTAALELKVRGLEDAKFNRAEPDYAFVTERPELQAFVDEYLNNGTLCFSKDDAERGLFQFYMGPISTVARREFLALPSDEQSQKELGFLREHAMAGVVNPKTDKDRRRHAIFHKRHDQLTFVPWASGQAGGGSWTAVSRVSTRKKEIGKWYDAKILRQYGSGNTATFDVRFDCGYVAKGVAAGDVRRGRTCAVTPDVGTTGEACYRGTKLDLDHVGLGWRWEPVAPSAEYPDGLMWYRILGIRDLLDYDINRNLSGYEWAKNLDLLDYFKNYYNNALCEVGGYGIAAEKWVFKWLPAAGWAYGVRS